jgi:hypothetical protein
MRYLLAFLRFWYDFIVGDDWVVAAGVLAALGLTALLAGGGVNAWWVMPLAVIALLAGSLRRGLRESSQDRAEPPEPWALGEPRDDLSTVPSSKGH